MEDQSGASFTIKGINELVAAVSEIADKAMPHIKAGADKGGGRVLAAAKGRVQVKSGKLKAALKLRKQNVKPGKVLYYSQVTIPGTKMGSKEGGAHHIVPLELGHRVVVRGKVVGKPVKAYPFLRPAADENKDAVVDDIIEAMNKALDEIGGML